MEKVLVILSGGQDSTTCLALAKLHVGVENVHAITFDYGQRHRVELESADKVRRMAGIPDSQYEVLHLPDTILQGTSPLTNKSEALETYENADVLPGGIEKTFVPGRNILFLVLAANRAVVHGCDTLCIGVAQEDFGGYPDCRDKFIALMQKALNEGLFGTDPAIGELDIWTPLMFMSKKETVNVARSIPGAMELLAYSHTCYAGGHGEFSVPCGHCHACLLRQRGFDQAGVEDPLLARLRLEGKL